MNLRNKPQNFTARMANYKVHCRLLREMCVSWNIFTKITSLLYEGRKLQLSRHFTRLLFLCRTRYSKWKAFGRFPWSFRKVFHRLHNTIIRSTRDDDTRDSRERIQRVEKATYGRTYYSIQDGSGISVQLQKGPIFSV